MDSRVHLAVDIMSGDHGLRVSLPASLRALESHPLLHLHLVGDSPLLERELAHANPTADQSARLRIVPAASVLPMDAAPAEILRGSRDSSLHEALTLLAEGQVGGVVSAGNTAALMALGRRQITMLPGFSRPAYCSAIPVDAGFSYMLDLGANVDCDADSLVEFARLGTALVIAQEDCPRPRVALLSNGSEASKGNLAIREAAQRLENDPGINYCGFIEGDELHLAKADLIVCDGLVGNVALKTAEGTAELARRLITENFSRPWWLQWLARPALRNLQRSLSAERHGGAFLLGLKGVVVKSHGNSSIAGFAASLDQATRCLEQQLVPSLEHYFDNQPGDQSGRQEINDQ